MEKYKNDQLTEDEYIRKVSLAVWKYEYLLNEEKKRKKLAEQSFFKLKEKDNDVCSGGGCEVRCAAERCSGAGEAQATGGTSRGGGA
jgi:hypothetical protein